MRCFIEYQWLGYEIFHRVGKKSSDGEKNTFCIFLDSSEKRKKFRIISPIDLNSESIIIIIVLAPRTCRCHRSADKNRAKNRIKHIYLNIRRIRRRTAHHPWLWVCVAAFYFFSTKSWKKKKKLSQQWHECIYSNEF